MYERLLTSRGITIVGGKISKSQAQAAIAIIVEHSTEAGVKDWIAGVGMSLVALFSSIDASASAKDVDEYLGVVEEKIEKSINKDPALKDKLGLNKSFKQVGNGSKGEYRPV